MDESYTDSMVVDCAREFGLKICTRWNPILFAVEDHLVDLGWAPVIVIQLMIAVADTMVSVNYF
jgi:hypothetical protein